MANPITLTTPLPAEDLFFESMSLSAGLSKLGEMQLSLLSEKESLAPTDLLGKLVTVNVELLNGSKRHFNGYITRFGQGAHRGRYFGYQATVMPWLWFLTRTSDCRIFQDLSVPDIVKKVFADHGVANFEAKLFRTYQPHTYCVQYRESDYDFVARLLEHEGIYWYFEHTDGAHKLVLVDSQSAHDAAPGYESLRYIEDPANAPPDQEYLSNWSFVDSVKSGKTVLTSYDFERPATSLQVETVHKRSYDLSDYERFDFDGDYTQKADGAQWAENRMDEVQARFQRVRSQSNALGLAVGCNVKVAKHPRDDQNIEYLVTQLDIKATLGVFASEEVPTLFQCQLEGIPSAQQFRPTRRTPKPMVRGPQTAVVVGPAGEEIYTDKYGRVKVQFHWDRYGQKNDKSSCWVRVSHPWAGKNFGMIHIPRIGQEVVVDFLEGDPDQPLVTGRVYNAEQMPPWELPANATQSGILTRSSKGGGYGNANAIRFEDKAGSEQVWIHAEKNQDIEVENDESHWVGHDRTKTVDHDETVHVKHDRTETVDNNETITIGVNRTERVGSNETITIGANRVETVGSNETITIGANRTESVGSNETITIGSNRSITVGSSETATVALQRTHSVGINETISVGAAQEVNIGGAQTVTVGLIQNISVGANQSTDVGRDQSTSVGRNQATTVGANREIKVSGGQKTEVAKARVVKIAEDDGLTVGKKLVIEAADSITLKSGKSELVLKKDGTISLNGKDITFEGSGKVTVKAGGDMVLKGSKIAQN
jgi:type VI secretion system secreted protein VgrG